MTVPPNGDGWGDARVAACAAFRHVLQARRRPDLGWTVVQRAQPGVLPEAAAAEPDGTGPGGPGVEHEPGVIAANRERVEGRGEDHAPLGDR